MATILERIAESRLRQIAELRAQRTEQDFLRQAVDTAPPPRSLEASLREGKVRDGIAVIAEVKRASPSKGLLCNPFDPEALADAYAEGGASGISVLTEPSFFQGDNGYLTAVRKRSPLPVLRKDFLLDPIQVYEARAIGADAVLLIAALLDTPKLRRFLALTRSLGMEALCEAHDERELDAALQAGASLIGVNNRNLATFEVSLAVTERLRKGAPSSVLFVSESGIHTREDVRRVMDAGADAILVGESLVREHIEEIPAKLRTLRGR